LTPLRRRSPGCSPRISDWDMSYKLIKRSRILCHPRFEYGDESGAPPEAEFSPADIANMVAWYKADAITGLDDGDPIGTWEDQSGNGYHLTQSEAGYKPTYDAEDPDINNMPAVYFDNNDKFDYVTIDPKADQPVTWAFVFYNKLDHQSEHLLYCSGTGHVFNPRYNPSPTLYWTMRAEPYATHLYSNVRLPTAWDYWVCLYDGSNSYMRKGGSEVGSGTVDGGALENFTLGLQLFGSIAEAIVYSKRVTTEELFGLEGYFKEKYAL